ncbi:MAG: DUF4091 domain-containing protein [Planctomycetota bacterium]|jgi:hypothetical protein
MQNYKFVLVVSVCIFSFCHYMIAAEVDKDFLKTLPPGEQAIANEVDHWGLPFSDQLRRFISAKESFKKQIGQRAPENFIVGVQHGLEKIPRNKYWFKGKYTNKVHIEAAANEYENFQVAILPDVGKELKKVTLTASAISAGDGKTVIPASNIKIYRVGYVETVPVRYPSLYRGKWPDYLSSNGPMKISGTDLGLFWVEVKVPADAKAGEYSGQLILQADGERVPINLSVRVYNFKLPNRVPFPMAVWLSSVHPSGEEMDLKEYRLLLSELLKHGIDPISIGYQFYLLEDVDFSILDENLEFCFERGLEVFEIGRGKEYRENPEKLKPLIDHLCKKGWLKKAIIYSNQDEPDEKQFRQKNIPFYKRIKSLYPDLKVFLASEWHPNIDQGCDIWMTDLSTGTEDVLNRTSFGKSQRWFYYCHLPVRISFYRPLVQAPNMLIDNEAIEHRLSLWLAWKYKTTGMFIWAGNSQWKKLNIDKTDWENKGFTLPDKPYPFPYAGVHNGNGFLVYPGAIPSIRLKVLRDGLEDYGYFAELNRLAKISKNGILKEKADKLLAIPGNVLINPHYFNRDPKELLKTRNKIAELIEEFTK